MLGAVTNVGVTLFRAFVPGASAARLLALLVEAASNVNEIDWKEYAENYSNDIHGSIGFQVNGDPDDNRIVRYTERDGLATERTRIISELPTGMSTTRSAFISAKFCGMRRELAS